MHPACNYADCMATHIQIRNVPEEVHRTLKSRAALAGLSLSEFLLQELAALARRPPLAEVITRIQSREPVDRTLDSVEAVRAVRDRC